LNDVLKQRLVGALILVALGVVFWPIIFVEPDSPAGSLDARIPPRPDIDTSALPSPDRVGLRASPPLEAEAGNEEALPSGRAAGDDPNTPAVAAVEPAAPVLAPPAEAEREAAEVAEKASEKAPAVAARTRDAAPARPEIDAQGVPVAWMLQVISVSRKGSAEQTRQALQDMGHKAYIKSAQVEGRTVYRVYLGPKFERASLAAIKGEVDARFGVQSMVLRYLP
jgi:DedD protein